MTNEQVMQLFTEFGAHEGGIENWVQDNIYVEIINKAVAIEREACAKVCENLPTPKDATTLTHIPTLETCAAAIRARGEK